MPDEPRRPRSSLTDDLDPADIAAYYRESFDDDPVSEVGAALDATNQAAQPSVPAPANAQPPTAQEVPTPTPPPDNSNVLRNVPWVTPPASIFPDFSAFPEDYVAETPVSGLEDYPDEKRIPWTLRWVEEMNQLRLTEACYPSTGFFPRFLRHAEAVVDSPVEHQWSVALTTFATALGPDHTIAHNGKWLQSNLFVVNISDSGEGRKSTTLDLGITLLPTNRYDTTINNSDVAMLDGLNDNNRCEFRPEWCLLCLDEASALFGQMNSKFQKNMLPNLISLYDGRGIKTRARTSGNSVVENPCVSLIGAMACEEW